MDRRSGSAYVSGDNGRAFARRRGDGPALWRGRNPVSGHDEGPPPVSPKDGEFHFIRLEYTDLPQFHRGFGFGSRNGQGEGWWVVDWPDADDHFSRASNV
jgi:hypothetical protein